jgi:hypothetical protein
MATALEWHRHDVEFEDLLSLSFEAATERFRSQGPSIIVSRLAPEAGPDWCVANLLAPEGRVLWAAAAPQALASRRLPADATLRTQLKTELKASLQRLRRTHKDQPQRKEWLRALLEDLGEARGGPLETLCTLAPTFREIGRRRSCVLPAAAVGAFIDEQNRLLDELGGFAFYGVDERAIMLDALEPGSLRSAFLSGLSPLTFHGMPEAWDALNQRLLSALLSEIRSLEAGGAYSFQTEALRIVNPVVNLHLPAGGALRQRNEACLLQILSCRARLVRLLGWPSHLPSALSALGTRDSALPTIDSYGALAPFHAGDELRAYVADMRSRHPQFTATFKSLA